METSHFRVRTGDAEGRATHWFASFLAKNSGLEPIQEILDSHNSHANASGVLRIGDYLIFDTEQDFTLFVLKWS